MIRVERNFIGRLVRQSAASYAFLLSGPIDPSMLDFLEMGSKVYIRVEIIANTPIPANVIRVYDTNRSMSLNFGMLFYPQALEVGHHVLYFESTMTQGKNMDDWAFYIWDSVNGSESPYDITFINASLTLNKSDIWTPAHADMTPEQIAKLPTYGEYKEIKAF